MTDKRYVESSCALEGGESVKKRKVVWFIGVIIFTVLVVTSILTYNKRIANIAERMRQEYGILDAPDVDPFWTTPSARFLVFFGFALFISGIFVVGSKK